MTLRTGPALMLVDRSSAYHAQLAAGLGAVLHEVGLPVVSYLCPSSPDGPGHAAPLRVPGLARLLDAVRPGAIVVTPMTAAADDAHLAELLGQLPGVPHVHLGATGGQGSVRADNAMGMDLIVEHLVARCRARRLLVVRGLAHHPDSHERMAALTAALARHGRRAQAEVDGSFDRLCAFRAVRQHLEHDPGIDAIVALNDCSALGALDAAQSLGLRVPADLVVTGFDGEDLSALSRPALTTISQDPYEQGRTAARLVLRLLAGAPAQHVRVPVQLRVRASTVGDAQDAAVEHQACADLLWSRLSETDTTLAVSRALAACRTLEEAGHQLALALPRHGVLRARLLLPDTGEHAAPEPVELSLEDGTARRIRREGGPEEYPWLAERLDQASGTSFAVHPLAVGDDELAMLAVEHAQGASGYVPEALIMDVARIIGAVLRSRRLEREVAARRAAQEALLETSHHDPVTGLQNRSAFLLTADDLLTALRGTGAALCLVDLDRFNDVNVSMGHVVGDALLRQVAERLARAAGGHERVFRLGGDDFAVVVAGGRTATEALEAAGRLVTVLEEPFVLDGLRLEVEATVGVAGWPWQAQDARSLFRMADVALYRAKVDHREAALYDPEDGLEAPRRVALVRALRRALAEGQLRLHYQPIADISRRRVTGVEALLRWEHPDQGLLAPDHFIEIAEQTGLIHPITSYVLNQALQDSRAWRDQGVMLRMAVNLSPRRLADPGLTAEVGRLLARHRIPPGQVELEVTEGAAMADPRRAMLALRDLRGLGVDLSVDDFGTGHASLAYLSRLPVTCLKIDRSFVTSMEADPANLTIVQSVLDLARNLGLEVVAEGVETSSAFFTLARLDPLGRLRAQGFWLSRAVPMECLLEVAGDIDARLTRPTPPRPRRPGRAPVPSEPPVTG